jgi:glycerate kinase
MGEQYYIVTVPFGGFSASEISTIAAKALRAQDRKSRVFQFPLIDGGEGTIEHLVTSSLGSFLEVEATGADGEAVIVPLGFAGENGSIGIIEMKTVAAEPELAKLHQKKTSKKNKGPKFSGTTFGIGELIQDVLDEGAFSVILGWDEPLARDGGLGMAQALGVKFLDAEGKELDFKKETPIAEIKSVDASGRPFALLSSKFLVARTEALRPSKQRGQTTVEDTLFEEELDRLAEILKQNCNITVNVSTLRSGGSYIDFGFTAFLGAEVRDGAMLVLEASNLRSALLLKPGPIFFFTEKLEDAASEKATAAAKEVLRLADESRNPLVIITSETAKASSESRYKNKIGPLQSVYSLAEIPLFMEPLTSVSPQAEHRRHLQARLEKLFMRLLHDLTEQEIEEVLKTE